MCVWLVPRSTGVVVVVVGWRQFPKILLTYGRGLINAKRGLFLHVDTLGERLEPAGDLAQREPASQ